MFRLPRASRKFTTLIASAAAIVAVPPFDRLEPSQQANLITALVVAFILATGLESGLERFGSKKDQ